MFSLRQIWLRLLAAGAFGLGGLRLGAEDVYLEPDAFVAAAFPEQEIPTVQRLWLTAELKPDIRRILGHDYAALRLRYWQHGGRTVWILEEIGKVKPITTGLVVDSGHLAQVQVLVYRESHGWEVKHPFFTDQFKGATLKENLKLDRRIDGIAGATLSVNALRNLGRLALYLDQQVQESSDS